MFEYIIGKIAELTPTYAVLECNQLGYFVHISLNTYVSLENKETAKLYIYEAVREDSFTLYGFSDKEERNLFLLLISVSGIGANTARMILSSFSVAELESIILNEDSAQLKTVKGLGLKTAQRIIIDLKDKVNPNGGVSGSLVSAKNENKDEAIAALVMLGFNKSVVLKVVDKMLEENPTLQVEKIIKEALKRM